VEFSQRKLVRQENPSLNRLDIHWVIRLGIQYTNPGLIVVAGGPSGACAVARTPRSWLGGGESGNIIARRTPG
jgi:hypothetical protein